MGQAIKTKLYFAYGMNTNLDQMNIRCPDAKPLGKAILDHYRFEFKNYATIVPSYHDQVEGVLWAISDADEWALDILEGYPTFYQKIMVPVRQDELDHLAMTYIMTPREQIHPPGDSYYATVSEGYQQFGLSQRQLLEARARTLSPMVLDF